MSIYQMENPTIGDLEKGNRVRFPDGSVYECLGKRRAKKALGGEVLVFRRIQKLTPRMYSKPLYRLPDQDDWAWYEWRLDDDSQDSNGSTSLSTKKGGQRQKTPSDR